MAEEAQPQAGTTTATQAAAADGTTTAAPATTTQAQDANDVAALPEWARKVIEDLRKESASHRTAKTKAEKDAAEAARKAAEEQGKYRELYEGVKPKAERAEALETFLAGLLESELAAVPDKLKAIVPEFDDPLKKLEWVRQAKAAGVLVAPQAPRTDAVAGTSTGATTAATAANRAAEIELWRRLGLNNAVRAAEQGQG